jgi:hypothetical protein
LREYVIQREHTHCKPTQRSALIAAMFIVETVP